MKQQFVIKALNIAGAAYSIMGLIDRNDGFLVMGAVLFCTSLILEKLEK